MGRQVGAASSLAYVAACGMGSRRLLTYELLARQSVEVRRLAADPFHRGGVCPMSTSHGLSAVSGAHAN
jgi:hypothetical protein